MNSEKPASNDAMRPNHRPANSPGGANGFGIDPQALLKGLLRRWLVILVVGLLVGGAAGAATWFYLPPGKWTAYRQLFIAANQPRIAFGASGDESRFEVFKATQIALLKSRQNISAALRQPKVAGTKFVTEMADPLSWVQKELRVHNAAGPEILQISLNGSGEQIKDLQLIVDAVTNEYLEQEVVKARSRQEAHLEQLRKLAKTYETKLKTIRNSLAPFRLDGAATDPQLLAMRQQLAQQEYAQSTSELTRTRGEIREITTQLAHLESGKTTGFTVSKEEIRSAIDREPAIAQELARLEAMDRVIDREAERYVQGRKAAGLQTLIKEMTDARAFLEKKKVELTQSMQHRLQEEKARAAALNATNLKQRLSYLQNLEKLLVADCERLSKASRQLNDGALKVEDVRHEMEEADKMLRTIQHKVETMEIEMDAPPRIRTFDGGESTVQVPDESLRRLTFGGMAALGGFAVVALGIGLLEIRIRRLSGPADVVEHLGLPVLGKLPFCKGGKGRTAAIRQNMLKEAVDSTRTILLSGGARGCRTILVGSPVSGEGKTSLSCHLAASLGRAGRRVLLIDGDLRKPDVHKVFGQVNNQGLCGVLRNEESLENLVLPSGLPGLWILPAGRSNEDALRGLADGNFQLLLDQAKEQFDFILIDSPPLLTVSDGLVKATSVDGVIFAAFEGKTQISRLLDAISQVTSAGVRVLGVIINGVKGDEPSSYKDYSRYIETPATATNN